MLFQIFGFPAAVGSAAGGSNLLLSLTVTGVIAGALYGLIGITLALMIRSSGVLSFAHAGFSLMAAYMYAGFACPLPKGGAQCSAHPTLSPTLALIVIVVATTIVGLLVEQFVVRPLQDAAMVTKVVATAAVLSLIAGILLEYYGPQPRYTPPKQQLLPVGGFKLGGVSVSWQQSAIFVFAVILVAGIGLYLQRSWFGLAIRAAGQKPDVAQLLGADSVRISRFNWALGSALSAVAGVLLAPVEVVNVGTFGFLTIKSVGAMVIGGLVSLPLTFVGGLLIGVLEYATPDFWKAQGSAEVVIAIVLALALFYYRKRLVELAAFGVATANVKAPGPVSLAIALPIAALAQGCRRLPKAAVLVPLVILLLVPLHSVYYASIGINGIYYSLLALSMVVVSGITGQISFVQAGFVGIGAYTFSSALGHHGWNILSAGLLSLAVCSVLGYLVGVIALRYRDVEFIILTLAFSAVASDFALETHTLNHPSIQNTSTLGVDLLSSKSLYVFSLVVAAMAVLVVINIRRSAWGRTLTNMREMRQRIGHFGYNPIRAGSALMAVSGAIAGLAGCILALSLTAIDTSQFTPLLSVTVVLVAVIGGVRSIWGALAAGLVFGPGQQITAHLVSSNSANAFPEIASAVLAVIIVVYAPNGIAGLGLWATDVMEASGVHDRWWFRGDSQLLEGPDTGITSTPLRQWARSGRPTRTSFAAASPPPPESRGLRGRALGGVGSGRQARGNGAASVSAARTGAPVDSAARSASKSRPPRVSAVRGLRPDSDDAMQESAPNGSKPHGRTNGTSDIGSASDIGSESRSGRRASRD